MAKKNAKTSTPVAQKTEKPVVEKTTESTEPANDVVETTTETTTETGFGDLLKKLTEVTSLLATVKQEARALEKRLTRELKAAQKANAKKKAGKGNRSPSGFVKPTLISEELAAFLGKAKGTEMARTEVTREINKYIRDQGLQCKENGRKINPDAKLSKLLNLSKKDELTYFNLQRYMSPHFAKAGQAPAASGSN
jgi:upstream activation factor subunit UAF30